MWHTDTRPSPGSHTRECVEVGCGGSRRCQAAQPMTPLPRNTRTDKVPRAWGQEGSSQDEESGRSHATRPAMHAPMATNAAWPLITTEGFGALHPWKRPMCGSMGIAPQCSLLGRWQAGHGFLPQITRLTLLPLPIVPSTTEHTMEPSSHPAQA